MGARVVAAELQKSVGVPTSSTILEILQQIQQAFQSTFYIDSEETKLELDHVLVVSSKYIARSGRDYIEKALLGKVNTQHIDFWDAEIIADQIIRSQES